MKRRGFLGAILAAGVSPAFVSSGILMPIKRPIEVPPLFTAEDIEHGLFYGMQPGDIVTFSSPIAGKSMFRITTVTSASFELGGYGGAVPVVARSQTPGLWVAA